VTDSYTKKANQWILTVSADESQVTEAVQGYSLIYGCYPEGPILHITFPQQEGVTQTATIQLEGGGRTAILTQKASTGSGLFDATIIFSGRLTKQVKQR
jgi:uncharacterized protein YraI